jgi:uncharacterized membrane protein
MTSSASALYARANGCNNAANGSVGDKIAQNIEEIVRIEQRDRLALTPMERLANIIAGFSGSMLFVAIHVVWFTAWVVLNTVGPFGIQHLDPFPFNFLTMAVSLEAIFLSTFVLMSQNRQAVQAEKRAKIDLQVNLIAEQEVTKAIELITAIHEHLGIAGRDPEVRDMTQPTHVEHLVEAVDDAEQAIDPGRGKGPGSAIDTTR